MTRQRRQWRMRPAHPIAPLPPGAGPLAGGIAHDVRNLLTAIFGTADALGARLGLDQDSREDVATIRATAERAAALLRHLTASGAERKPQARVLAANEAMRVLAPVLRGLFGRQIRIDLALADPGPFLRIDPLALDQVLLNLGVNAGHAMPDGGTLTLRTATPPGDYAVLEVRDTGTGIAPQTLPHIFEPFFTTRHAIGGSGIGLATVQAIVQGAGGFVAVETQAGRGTTMRVHLPRWAGEAPADLDRSRPAARQRPLPPATPAGPRHVLLVDDEDVVRRITERGLARHGWHVLAVASAEAALALLDGAVRPVLHAVVSDLVLPGLDGAALLQALRARTANPALPGVLVSGYAGGGLPRSVGDEATAFLAKPFDVKDLTTKLAELLARPVRASAG